MAVIEFHEFETREELAGQLSDRIADLLEVDHSTGNFASIALSGGSTPKMLLEQLSEKLQPNMDMTYYALVDERFVPANDERSNERMIRSCMGLQDSTDLEFLSLYQDGYSAAEAAQLAHSRLEEDEELPFDVITLGMGTDGHTASFFPEGDNLDAATSPNATSYFISMQAPGADEPRITMTLPVIASASNLFLHIEGDEKRKVFEQACLDGPVNALPIRHVLRHPQVKLHVYWAP